MPKGDVPLVALLAEEPVAHIVSPLPLDERVVTERYCVNLGAARTQTVVQRVRCWEGELGSVIAEVRALVAERRHHRAIWFVGPSSRPPNLLELLRQRGFVPTTTAPFEPQYAAMILMEPPTPPPRRADLCAALSARPTWWLNGRWLLSEGFKGAAHGAGGCVRMRLAPRQAGEAAPRMSGPS